MALSSAAYGPEAALSLLIPLGLLGVRYIVPVSAAIIVLLTIVYFSYRQTIAAYPSGGGSYTVARFNLGASAGLLAASALLADYILTAAVGISAGVGALVSAVPMLLPHTVAICVGILDHHHDHQSSRRAGSGNGICRAHLSFCWDVADHDWRRRDSRSSKWRTSSSGGRTACGARMTEAVTYWLLLKVFASGCTALTGVEAVSNGVKAFREPTVKNAQLTLTIIIFLLAVLLAGISFLVKSYGVVATDPGQPGYQSVLSMLTAAVFGKGVFYYLTMGAILIVLSFSANTAFADFPRLCRAIAQQQLSSACFRVPWQATGLHLRHCGAGAALRRSADSIWRGYGPADSAVRGGCVPGFYTFAIGYGGALAEETRARTGGRALW